MPDPLAPVPSVADVARVRGVAARADAAPDLLLEVPHGATRAAHFDALRAALVGAYPDDLRDFFFVNTDVGAPELAQRIAERFVGADPARTAVVVRCLVPRTFVDCNRVVPPDAVGAASRPGQMTPGLMPWVKDDADRRLLLARHAAYGALVARAADATLARGGRALMVHTYAPRSVDVAVDERIVASLHDAYRPEVVERWPLRAPVDLITKTPDGAFLADGGLVTRVRAGLASLGVAVAENEAYGLHPSTSAAALAARFPGTTLCFEVRRDLLVRRFTPFLEMATDPDAVDRLAAPFAAALAAG
ncbi:MAG: N-formylglutamate amidohydrolase [Planctomycetia bacterium]|nr:N-formylglutamate amidohydrolase [Planctomycetia bacterium]